MAQVPSIGPAGKAASAMPRVGLQAAGPEYGGAADGAGATIGRSFNTYRKPSIWLKITLSVIVIFSRTRPQSLRVESLALRKTRCVMT